MAIPPIFKFKSIQTRLTDPGVNDGWILVYGVIPNTGGTNSLDVNISPTDVSTVILTVQVSNVVGSDVLVSAAVQNSTTSTTFDENVSRRLVLNYPLMPQNAFDPLSGNLVLAANDQLWMKSSVNGGCDVVVSLLEIANATAN
jgi:hypothetical protein